MTANHVEGDLQPENILYILCIDTYLVCGKTQSVVECHIHYITAKVTIIFVSTVNASRRYISIS